MVNGLCTKNNHFRSIFAHQHLKTDSTMSIIETFGESAEEGFKPMSSSAQGECSNHCAMDPRGSILITFCAKLQYIDGVK